MCVGSVRHSAYTAQSIGLLQLFVLTIGLLDCDTNFDFSPASCVTQMKPIDPIFVGVVTCVLERWVQEANAASTPGIRIRKVKVRRFGPEKWRV
jgi:hypothetical protein